jgi:adenosylcobinamide-phosphate synthase
MMGESGRREANALDIRKALKLYWAADLILVTLFGAAGFVIHLAR